MNSARPLEVKAQMLIRRPVAEVYNAFVDPQVTTRFWFTRSSGRLEPQQTIRWDWDMYGVSTLVRVLALEQERRITLEWDDPATQVEWQFTPVGEDATFVQITNRGFQGTPEQIVAQALDSTGGFSLVLAGLKALLEHGLELNLVADHAPQLPTP